MWDYRVYAKPTMFYIGIKVGSTVYKTHGVNKNGGFGCLPYMNDPAKGVYQRGKNYQRLDLLVDRYIGGEYSYDDVRRIVAAKDIVNVPNASMHSLFADASGRALLVEPGLGYREIAENYAVISNFPLLEELPDLSAPWYGKDRYDTATSLLQSSGGEFSAADGMELLRQTAQGGEWATRVSFVYSRNENAVYYALERDFSDVKKHSFE